MVNVDLRAVAGEFILAVADGDAATMHTMLAATARGEIDAIALLVTLASTAARQMEATVGDGWRDALNFGLLEVSVEEVDEL